MLTNPRSYNLQTTSGSSLVAQVPVHISWLKKNTKCYVKARESQVYLFLIMKLVETKTN